MKIGLMTAWNQDAGPSICSELIGRQWVKEGHQVKVFSFLSTDFHGTAIVGKDEDYVCRCFSTIRKGEFDPRPILEFRPDLFIAQDLGMFPMDELVKIFPLIKRTALTVNVIHDAGLSQNPSFYQFDWDRIVCFDQRYRNFVRKVYDDKLIKIIPHPLKPWRPGDKKEARKKLNLPQNKYILFVFGQGLNEKLKILGSLRSLSKKYDIFFLVVSHQKVEVLKGNGVEIEIREESPDLNKLYDYLYAADALIINKGLGEGRVVVSTTVYQCLGSGCPIFAFDSNLVETVPDNVIVKYRTYEEFEKKLVNFFDNKKRVKELKDAQENYVKENSPGEIAKAYLELLG
jgi:hypothetical protein